MRAREKKNICNNLDFFSFIFDKPFLINIFLFFYKKLTKIPYTSFSFPFFFSQIHQIKLAGSLQG
tara:strand:+ start:436 stop:630 length:195 start_codon:yes stop_codon:yes gene_type:complete